MQNCGQGPDVTAARKIPLDFGSRSHRNADLRIFDGLFNIAMDIFLHNLAHISLEKLTGSIFMQIL